MTQEQLRMQMLAGIITEGQYKAKLNEVGEGLKLPAVKQDLIEELEKVGYKILQFINKPSEVGDGLVTTQEDPKTVVIDLNTVNKYLNLYVNSSEKTKIDLLMKNIIEQPGSIESIGGGKYIMYEWNDK